MLTKLMSGGAGYLILTILGAGTIGTVYLKYTSAIDRAETAEAELATEKSITASQRITIGSQARSNTRRTAADNEQQDTEDQINAETDSTQCASSGPIQRGFGIMRERAGQDVDDNPQ